MKAVLLSVLLYGLIGFIYCQKWNKNHCGRRPLVEIDGDKVVGGNQSKNGDWPWSCSLRSGAAGSHICGGSLINDRWIVTAAHCVSSPNNPGNYKWKCGLHHRTQHDTWTKEFTSKRAIVHPQYNSRLIQNDIALFELNILDIDYDDYIMPICMPQIGANYANKVSVGMGWGTLFSGGSLATYHMEVEMPILTDSACAAKFSTQVLPQSQICAGEDGQNKDTCQGDSGGPLVVKDSDGLWYLAGLTSWGYGCGDGGVYTRLSAFRNWIMGFVSTLPDGSGN